ncbi:TniQ family protein [Streptomyces beijiangensis]|uniref:TniQ family protein n=1 Tax=Streptomyces beijiangensis TaxID=163361 RepID=A0A939JHT4_9ACTN|nr:TniQ family protein [Streptomyces beijiangensis]MBO0512972.1 TniQ family protein [Streptomyces beijiangensis]
MPGERESLSSWINRIGLLYEIRQPDLLACLGLTAQGEMRPTTAGLGLASSSLDALSVAAGVPVETIGGMLLSRFAATALPNLPPPPFRHGGDLTAWAAGAWVLRRHSNFCPKCLARDGQWRLDWKLPWSFVCLDHRVYLRNSCPRCKRVQSGLSWGRDSRVCPLRWRQSVPSLDRSTPHPEGDNATVCRGRLDQDETVPLADRHALQGQKRLLRWLYGTPEESAQETEFASLTAIAAQRLAPDMLSRAQAELRPVLHFEYNDAGWPQGEPELSPLWTDPLRMAGAAHVAQRLSAHGYRPQRTVQWLKLKQPLFGDPFAHLMDHGHQLYGTSLVFGPFHHDTAHVREALRTGLVSLPYQGPAYINSRSPHRLHPVAGSEDRQYPREQPR